MTNRITNPQQTDVQTESEQLNTLFVPRRQRLIGKLSRAIFFPPVLRQLDRHLLLNVPWLWATKLHRIAWLSGILTLAAVALGLLLPVNNLAGIPSYINSSIFLITVVQIGLFLFWLYGSDHYHIEHERGKLRDSSGLLEYGSYVAALLLIGSSTLCFILLAQLRIRTIDITTFSADIVMLEVNQEFMRGPRRTLASSRENEVRETYAEFFARVYVEQDWRLGRFIEEEAPYWADDELLQSSINASDLNIYRDAALADDNQPLNELIGKYTNQSASEIERSRSNFRTDGRFFASPQSYVDFSYDAIANAHNIYEFGFSTGSNRLPLVSALVLLAIAIHGALLRFNFRHAGLRVWLGSALAVVGMLIVVWFVSILSYPAESFFENNFHPWQSYSTQESERFYEWYFGLVLTGYLAVVLSAYARCNGITKATSAGRWRGLQLALLPILLIAVPYALYFYVEAVTEIRIYTINGGFRSVGFFSRHFIRDDLRDVWSLAPLGIYVLYLAQFVYVPLIPFLKRQHTRLIALPKR